MKALHTVSGKEFQKAVQGFHPDRHGEYWRTGEKVPFAEISKEHNAPFKRYFLMKEITYWRDN